MATMIQQVNHTTLTEDVSYWPTVVYTFGKLDVFRQCNSVSYLAVRYKKFIEIILLFSFANKIILYCNKYCISIEYMWMLVRSVHLVESLMSAMNAIVDQVFNSATVFFISVPRWMIVPNGMALVTYAKVVNVQDMTSCSIVVNFVKKIFRIALLNGSSMHMMKHVD